MKDTQEFSDVPRQGWVGRAACADRKGRSEAQRVRPQQDLGQAQVPEAPRIRILTPGRVAVRTFQPTRPQGSNGPVDATAGLSELEGWEGVSWEGTCWPLRGLLSMGQCWRTFSPHLSCRELS